MKKDSIIDNIDSEKNPNHPKNEQKHRYYKLHENNVEFGTEMGDRESPEKMRPTQNVERYSKE